MAPTVKPPIDELGDLLARSTRKFALLMTAVMRASYDGDRRREQSAIEKLGKSIAQSKALADLIGRKRMMLEADAARNWFKGHYTRGPVYHQNPIVPDVPFDEAVNDILGRDPRLSRGWEDVQKAYADEH